MCTESEFISKEEKVCPRGMTPCVVYVDVILGWCFTHKDESVLVGRGE